MWRTYRYRLYPTSQQARVLVEQLAFCCDLYNAALQERREAWKRGISIGYSQQSRQLTEIRHAGLAPAMNFWTQGEALMRLDRAYQGFFRRCKNGEKPGYPHFHPRHRYNSLSWSLSGHSGGVAVVNRRLRLQGIGQVKVKWHRSIPEEAILKVVTVVRHGHCWEACFTLELPEPMPPARLCVEVGIDMGINNFAALSTGNLVEGPRIGYLRQPHLRRQQRKIARRQHGSRRRQKAVAHMGRLMEHEKEARRDHRHKLARSLVKRFSFIAVENLAILNMVRGAKGTKGLPGKNVKQKTGLNRSQLDQAWGAFLLTLKSKAAEAGSVVVGVDPRNTSITCHRCMTTDAHSRRSQSEFTCITCGYSGHADVNAALNILRLGRSLQALTVGDCPVPLPEKPLHMRSGVVTGVHALLAHSSLPVPATPAPPN